jgi:hypothetical protein
MEQSDKTNRDGQTLEDYQNAAANFSQSGRPTEVRGGVFDKEVTASSSGSATTGPAGSASTVPSTPASGGSPEPTDHASASPTAAGSAASSAPPPSNTNAGAVSGPATVLLSLLAIGSIITLMV